MKGEPSRSLCWDLYIFQLQPSLGFQTQDWHLSVALSFSGFYCVDSLSNAVRKWTCQRICSSGRDFQLVFHPQRNRKEQQNSSLLPFPQPPSHCKMHSSRGCHSCRQVHWGTLLTAFWKENWWVTMEKMKTGNFKIGSRCIKKVKETNEVISFIQQAITNSEPGVYHDYCMCWRYKDE